MKMVIALITWIFFCSPASATTKTWVGNTGNTWTSAASWSPAGVPVASDDVVFNTTVTVLIDASPISVNSLHFINNSSVIFSCDVTRNFRLFSTSSANPALLVEAGSIFTFDATNNGTNNSTLALSVAAGVLGSIYGTLIISGSGNPAGGPMLDTYNSATNYGVVTVYTGGMIRILPGAANTSSSSTPVSTIVMKDGSVYESLKNGGSFPDGNWAVHSLARSISPGSAGPSFNAAVYGDIEWNCPLQTTAFFLNKDVTFNNANFISTGSSNVNGEFRIKTATSAGVWTMTVNGDLHVGPTARLVTTSTTVSATNGARIITKGNVDNQGTITASGSAATVNDFQIAGTSPQTFSNTGIFSGNAMVFTMLNAAGLTLLTPLTLPGNAVLTTGRISTSPSTILTMIDNSTYTGGSPVSFIEGPIRKMGDDDFTFPVGKGNIYAPITMSIVSGQVITDQFTAGYVRSNPQSIFGSNYQLPINHISYIEYWNLVQTTGSAIKKITLTVSPTSFAKKMNTLLVARNTEGDLQWKNEGLSTSIAGPPSPPYITGMITSQALNQYGAFTIAASDAADSNPLPLSLIDFSGTKSGYRVVLKWELSEYCTSENKFEIQRSNGINGFNTFAVSNGSATSRRYGASDNNPINGKNYYRIKLTDPTGYISYSKTIMIIEELAQTALIALTQSNITNEAEINITLPSKQTFQIIIVDMLGKVVARRDETSSGARMHLPVELERLAKGVYFVFVESVGGRSNVVRFIR